MQYMKNDQILSRMTPPVLLTVKQFAEKHKAFTEGTIRQLIHASKMRNTQRGPCGPNGLDDAIVRLGRKIMIDENKFFDWLLRQRKPNLEVSHESESE